MATTVYERENCVAYHGHARLGRVAILMASHWPATMMNYDVNGWYVLIWFASSHCKLLFLFSRFYHVGGYGFFPYTSDLLFDHLKDFSSGGGMSRTEKISVHVSMSTTSGHNTSNGCNVYVVSHPTTWTFWFGLSFHGQGYTATVGPELDNTVQALPLNFTRIIITGANWRMVNYTLEGFSKWLMLKILFPLNWKLEVFSSGSLN